MTLLTENPTPNSVDLGGGAVSGRSFAVLDSQICQDMRWCVNCGGEQVFVLVYEFESGRVGYCSGCGDERIAPFSRVNSEAA